MKNTKINLNFGAIPYRKNEVLTYDVNISKLQILGWKPNYDIYSGLKKLIEEEANNEIFNYRRLRFSWI